MRYRKRASRKAFHLGFVALAAIGAGCRVAPTTPLAAAAAAGDVGKVKDLIGAGAPVDGRGDHGLSALHFAARRGQVAVIDALLAAGADIDLRDGRHTGWTALMHAIHKSEGRAALRLIEAGANVNAKSNGGDTPLMLAAGGGDCDRKVTEEEVAGVVRALLDRGADPYARGDFGGNALTNAVMAGRTSVVRMLVDRAPRLRLCEGWRGDVAVWAARFFGRREILELLEKSGADQPSTPHPV